MYIAITGVQRDVCFQSYERISEPQALLRAGFFPASPKFPQVAFAVSLLDLLEHCYWSVKWQFKIL